MKQYSIKTIVIAALVIIILLILIYIDYSNKPEADSINNQSSSETIENNEREDNNAIIPSPTLTPSINKTSSPEPTPIDGQTPPIIKAPTPNYSTGY